MCKVAADFGDLEYSAYMALSRCDRMIGSLIVDFSIVVALFVSGR